MPMLKMHENSVYTYLQKIDTRYTYAIVVRYIFAHPRRGKLNLKRDKNSRWKIIKHFLSVFERYLLVLLAR